MSNRIKTKLNTIDNKLDEIKNAVLDGKREIAYALKFNGIETVNPYDDTSEIYDTFKRYADLIRRLKSANAMILEFKIPDTAATAYQRTVILPLYFATNYAPSSINAIAQEIISANPSVSEYAINTMALGDEDYEDPYAMPSGKDDDVPYIIDNYGNECIDGLYVPTLKDIQTYLNEEQQSEMIDAMEQMGYGISMMSLDDDLSVVSETATNPDAVYNYTVEWGDGTSATYVDGAGYEANKAAMWHTYETAGVYDVSINGNFRYMRATASADRPSRFTANGQYINDVDGTALYSNENVAMTKYLISVIAWGNTLLKNCQYAFSLCGALKEVPMYDTTNSFAEVTDFSYMFNRCTALTSLPYNANTDKGLFSNCTKATTFTNCFRYCTGMTSSIPIKLIDGCTNVTSVAGMFGYAKFTGNIPTGLLKGMTALTNASEMFANCQLSGDLSEDLFVDCPNVTNINRLFYGCTGITGRITRNFIGDLTKLTDMRQAFYNCKGITGIDADAFYNITANNINCRDTFYGCSGITEIPTGLLESMTGTGLMLERMFTYCTGITSLSSTALANLKVANARGMFGGCTNLKSACPNANDDWNTYDTIKKWYGVFANTNLSDKSSVCLELGGTGNRKFSQGKVGAIVLHDKTTVDPNDYTYNASNKPIGIVYADVWVNPSSSIATLGSGKGNVVADGTDGAEHKLFVCTFSDTTRTWTSAQNLCEDVTTITNTSDVNVSYNTFVWTDNGDGTYTQARRATRYNGEAYSKALLKFIFEKGYASNVTDATKATYSVVTTLPTSNLSTSHIYFLANSSDSNKYDAYTVSVNTCERNETYDVTLNNITSDKYPAISYCNTYNNGVDTGTCFLPDGADLWDQFVQREMIDMSIDKVIAGGGGFTTSNCLPMRNNTWYWASAEGSSTGAWGCYTYHATVDRWNAKWVSGYVRPSFAISA